MEGKTGRMVQYGVWPNCCNSCDFCLREARVPLSREKQLDILAFIRENIQHIDWKDEYSCGISLLGGELYNIADPELQESFMALVDQIVEKILKVSTDPKCRYSTVTNGLYQPDFLYRVVDRIVEAVGIGKIDINFSYDLKYRFKSESDRLLVLRNINDFNRRYSYRSGVQMILTQYLIDMWRRGQFSPLEYRKTHFPDSNLCFLYPHPIHTGKKLDDFQFRRADFLDFLTELARSDRETYLSFVSSTRNSAVFKWTGYKFRDNPDVSQQPVLTDGKEILTECGHSVLYRCYADSSRCMLCDLEVLNG